MIKDKNDVIAIDGPAGSGKSTTARLVAQKLGFMYLDTGAMYRAFTLKVMTAGVDIQNETEILTLISQTKIEIKANPKRQKIFLDGKDVTDRIRSQEVSRMVSLVAANPAVRNWMVQLQRQIGAHGKIVAEGRDIGTVVFPDARLKIFLIASLAERAKRRLQELYGPGTTQDWEKIAAELNQRDILDSTRDLGPLKKTDDAIEVDTTRLTIEQQVDIIIQKWNQIEHNRARHRNKKSDERSGENKCANKY